MERVGGEPGMASLKKSCLGRNLNEMRKQVTETSEGKAFWAEGTAGANGQGWAVFCELWEEQDGGCWPSGGRGIEGQNEIRRKQAPADAKQWPTLHLDAILREMRRPGKIPEEA